MSSDGQSISSAAEQHLPPPSRAWLWGSAFVFSSFGAAVGAFLAFACLLLAIEVFSGLFGMSSLLSFTDALFDGMFFFIPAGFVFGMLATPIAFRLLGAQQRGDMAAARALTRVYAAVAVVWFGLLFAVFLWSSLGRG